MVTSFTQAESAVMRHFETFLSEAAGLLLEKLPALTETTPKFFLQFGTGFELDGLFDAPPERVPLHCIPGFPEEPTPDRIQPEFFLGTTKGIPVMVCSGHRHHAEGLGILPCILPAAIAKFIGITNHIFIDSGISLRPEFKLGRWMMLIDCINEYAVSPTDGCHHLFDNPYPDMTQTFSQAQNSELINALDSAGISPKLGIYLGRPGFHICTMAEAAIARNSGADLFGHDLVLETMFAHAFGARVSALALANAQWHENQMPKFTRNSMLEICRQCSPDLVRGLTRAIDDMSQETTRVARLPESQADEILSAPRIAESERRSPLRAFLPKYE